MGLVAFLEVLADRATFVSLRILGAASTEYAEAAVSLGDRQD